MSVRDESDTRRPESPDLLRRIVAVGRSLAETRDRAAICRTLREFVAEYVPFDAFHVTLLDRDEDIRRCIYCWGDGIEVDANLFERLPLDDGPASAALLTGQPVVCDGAADRSMAAQFGVLRSGEVVDESLLIVPMASGGRVIGSVQLQKLEPDFYSTGDIVPVAAVIDHAAAAIENALLLEEAAHARLLAERSAAREATLNRVGAMLYSAADSETVVSTAAAALRRALDAQRATFFRVTDDGRAIVAECDDCRPGAPSLAGTTVDVDRLPSQPLDELRIGEVVAYDDVALDPVFGCVAALVGSGGDVAGIHIPILEHGRLTALLFVGDSEPRRWEPEEITLAKGVAEQLAVALRQARLLTVAAKVREEWEHTFEAMDDAVALVDADDRVIRANPAFWRMSNSDGPKLGATIVELMHDDPAEAETCPACIARRRGVEGSLVVVLPSAEHRFGIHLEVLLSRVEMMSDGRPATVQVVRNVTAIRTAEAELRNRQAVLDTVLSSMTDAVALLDRAGVVLYGNPSAVRLGGMLAGGLVGIRVWDFVTPDVQPRVRENFELALNGQGSVIEYTTSLPDGAQVVLECAMIPVVEGGVVSGVVATGRDITERRTALERALLGEKLRALGQLSAGVAHDFNNLLTSILGHVQLLSRQDDLQDATVQRQLAAIERAARDGAETVRRIQRFTQVRFESDTEVVRVGELLEQSIDLARPRWKDEAQAFGVRITVDQAPVDSDMTVIGSGAELREVVTNLIFNAVDAMPDGGRIELSAEAVDSEVRIRVRDSGHGIDELTRGRIFEPFFTTRGPKNSGLGLAVSYGIVTRHGGTIEIESEPGVSTVFTIRLPAASPGKHGATVRDHAHSELPELTLRVLIVDDDEAVRNMLASALRSTGAEVVSVGTGREAIAAVRPAAFDVVVTDLGMPDVNGWEVARSIRAIDPAVRILVLTGWGEMSVPDSEHADAFEAVERVLAKPIDIDDFVESVKGRAGRG